MERASCLVVVNLDFVVLSLIYFSPRCFDLQDFNLKKRFEPLRKDSSCLPDQMSRQMYVVNLFTLSNQTAASFNKHL